MKHATQHCGNNPFLANVRVVANDPIYRAARALVNLHTPGANVAIPEYAAAHKTAESYLARHFNIDFHKPLHPAYRWTKKPMPRLATFQTTSAVAPEAPTAPTTTRGAVLLAIATRHHLLRTPAAAARYAPPLPINLTTTNTGADFYEVAVWNVAAALREAFSAGVVVGVVGATANQTNA